MKILTRVPSPPFDRFIDSYWSIELAGPNGSGHRESVIPDGKAQLIFHYGDPFRKLEMGEWQRQNRFILCGIHTKAHAVQASSNVGMIGVVFKSFGLKPLLNTRMPMNSLACQEVAISDTDDTGLRELEGPLAESSSFDQRIAILNNFFIRNFDITQSDHAYIARRSVQLIQASGGLMPISKLAEQVYASSRTLERIFRSEIGVTPKQFTQIIRFQRAIHLKTNNQRIDLTQLSHLCGFYDQSHFIRDFSSWAGTNPQEFFKAQTCGS